MTYFYFFFLAFRYCSVSVDFRNLAFTTVYHWTFVLFQWVWTLQFGSITSINCSPFCSVMSLQCYVLLWVAIACYYLLIYDISLHFSLYFCLMESVYCSMTFWLLYFCLMNVCLLFYDVLLFWFCLITSVYCSMTFWLLYFCLMTFVYCSLTLCYWIFV